MNRHEDVAATTERCSRCDVEMIRQPFYEGSKDECWFCPCCRSKLKTIEMLSAQHERRRAEMGLSEYEVYMEKLVKATVRTDPLSEDELRGLQRLVAERAKEWEPVCEHDTENPWT